MNSKLKNSMIFVAGAVVGSLISWKYLEAKHKKISDLEIESVKKTFSNMLPMNYNKKPLVKKVKDTTIEEIPDDITEYEPNIRDAKNYTSIIGTEGYRDYSSYNKKEMEDDDMDAIVPYVISPEEFGEHSDYECISLTLYSDGVLTHENNEVVDNIELTVGPDALSSFGQYEDHSVFVRNEELKCDYEILKDHGRYDDLVDKKPHEV